jgi:hypothetical protein
VGGILAVVALRRRARWRQREREQFAETRLTAERDESALADEITELDDDVERAGAPPEAKAAYLRAVDRYAELRESLRRAQTVRDLRAVAQTAADGRYEMACARAILEERQPPERRAPCFFDPRHGPSVEDVEYAPPGGQGRLVPVCAACRTRLQDGEEPDAAMVAVGGRQAPYWAAPGGGYYGGAFDGFTPGLLGGLLIGSSFGDAPVVDAGGGGWGFGGGGDFGGFGGGGDFGGGGGDFGGGGSF